jgi:hypothetical protein
MGSMKSRFQLRFRAIGTAIAGLVLLLESANSEFLRPHIEAWPTLVNLFIALFGAAFVIQSYVIAKQLQESSRPVAPSRRAKQAPAR